MPTAFIYCRVSTEEQAEHGYSLDAQEKFCRQFAQSNGFEAAAVFRDEGRSGTSLNRPGLKEMLARVQQSTAVDAVVVQETDRLARNTKDHLTVRAMLRKQGVKLISVAQPMLDDSPEGNMVDTIIASVNQFQSDLNGRKTKKGLQEKFESGWWPGWAPLGYQNAQAPDEERIVVPHPTQWALVRKALTLYLTGNHSAIELAERLYGEGLRSKTGKQVSNTVMTATLRNPFYAGIMVWNGQRRKGRHEPMISEDDHRRILEMIDARNLHASRRRRHNFLLNGFAFCGLCGGRYTAEFHVRKNIGYYHCDFQGKRGSAKPHTNKGQNVPLDDLERQVEDAFLDIQFSDDFIERVVSRVRELYREQREAVEGEKQALTNQRVALEQRRDIAEDKLFAGTISDDDFKRIKAKIEGELDGILDWIRVKDLERSSDVEIVREVLLLARDVHKAYKEAPPATQRRFLGLFWDRFVVQDREIVEAVPTKLIAQLREDRAVMISKGWLPSPSLLITLRDYRYLASLRAKVKELRGVLNDDEHVAAAGRSREAG